MTMLSNYGELKEAVKGYLLNRKDMDLRIPQLIALSERRIYRELRCPANEAEVYTELGTKNNMSLPRDYLECKQLRIIYENRWYELDRVSGSEFIKLNDGELGMPEFFTRYVKQLYWWPTQDSDMDTHMIYWQDLSGQLVNDYDTNEILRIAPDLYVYGALVESEPYLGHDDRIPVWNDMFNQALAQINAHAHDAEMSGSQLSMGTAYS